MCEEIRNRSFLRDLARTLLVSDKTMDGGLQRGNVSTIGNGWRGRDRFELILGTLKLRVERSSFPSTNLLPQILATERNECSSVADILAADPHQWNTGHILPKNHAFAPEADKHLPFSYPLL